MVTSKDISESKNGATGCDGVLPTPPLVILAIDPGASCGYAVIKVTKKGSPLVTGECRIIEYGHIDVDTKSPYMGDWCIDLTKRLEDIRVRVGATEVAVEDYFFSSRTRCGANVNPAYRTAIHIWARRLGLHYEIINITSWKVFICGRSTATRDQKARWGAEASKKLAVMQALWERHGIKFPNHSISEKTKKPIEFRTDCVDAVAQGMFSAFSRYKVTRFTAEDVVIPANHPFPKPCKKRFDYSKI